MNSLTRGFSFMKQCNSIACTKVDENHWIFALRFRISMAGYNRGHINPLARKFSFMKQCNAIDCADVDEKHWIYGLWSWIMVMDSPTLATM
jgi:hypothetical protein